MANARRGVARRYCVTGKIRVPQQINLYNPAFEARQASLSFKGALAGWALVALIVIGVAAYENFRVHSLEQSQHELDRQVAAAQTQLQRLGGEMGARRHDPRIAEEASRLEAEINGRQEVMDVLRAGSLGDTRGFSEQLKAFARQSFEGVWLTGLSIGSAGRDVALEGRALQASYVPSYLKRLNGESAMQGHPFSELLIQQPVQNPAEKDAPRPGYVEFRLTTKPEAAKAGAQ
jgi:hypothetical protein